MHTARQSNFFQQCVGDKFAEWGSGFSVQTYQADISSLLVSCPHIRTLHSQLVPAQVSYETFWMRYFYKVQLLEEVRNMHVQLIVVVLCVCIPITK